MTSDPKLPDNKAGIVARLEDLDKRQKVLNDERRLLNEAYNALKRADLKRSGEDLPYIDGRIAKHILNILRERGPIPEPELMAILDAGGGGRFKKSGQLGRSLNRLKQTGKVVETPAGLAIGKPRDTGTQTGTTP